MRGVDPAALQQVVLRRDSAKATPRSSTLSKGVKPSRLVILEVHSLRIRPMSRTTRVLARDSGPPASRRQIRSHWKTPGLGLRLWFLPRGDRAADKHIGLTLTARCGPAQRTSKGRRPSLSRQEWLRGPRGLAGHAAMHPPELQAGISRRERQP
jgi:hypothetical protein